VDPDDKTGRRGALRTLALISGAAGCGALALPTARFLVAPVRGGAGAGRWIKTVPLDSLREGNPKRVALVADRRDAWTLEKDAAMGAVWLVRQGSAVVAWSVVCPHLGCAIDRSKTGPGFTCPCHDSSFDAHGGRLTGPSPRGLDSLDTKIEDGFVFVDFRRFRQGTPDKVPVG
jgi:Rieske Fe-S protein